MTPNSPETWLHQAFQHYQAGNLHAAIAVYQEAQAHSCMSEIMYSNWGAHLQDLGDWTGAETAYRQALKMHPRYAAALYNLGYLMSLQHRHGEAETLLRQAIETKPDYADAYLALGHLLAQAGELAESMACFDAAEALTPHSALPPIARLFNLAYLPSTTAADMHACAVRATAHFMPSDTANVEVKRAALKMIRVGFVSGDLKDHPVGYFIENLLRHVDRNRFEWHVFSNFEAQDAVASRLHSLATTWTVIAGQSDATAKEMIQSKQIDILFDLSGHTALHRLSLFALRAAPVQVTWLGWHDTTGLATMDYVLTDRASMPPRKTPNGAPFLTEKPLYLSHTRLCMMPPADAPPVSALPALAKGFITFGSMQILAKISTVSLDLWARILHKIPTAKLIIRTKQFREPEMIEKLNQRAKSHGLPMARVALLPPLARADYLAAFADIDILLDTYPYPGGTTTAEALWMGVPTITLGGNTMISRQGVSLLSAANMQDWIANSPDDYVAKAVFWSNHRDDLQQLRGQLREQVAETALFNGALFARDFEAALASVTAHQLPMQP